jgi:aminoglycoside 3-N-acetyltransferase I
MMKTKIEKLTAQDVTAFQEMLILFDAVFEVERPERPSEIYLANLLHQSDFAVWVASIDNQVVGGLTMYILPQYRSIKRMGYLYDIAVKNDLQRKGIGQMLLSACRAWCAANQITELFLQAENEDEQAIRFYRKTGASELATTSFDYEIS